jgi:uncharacterized protein (DUF433 family)
MPEEQLLERIILNPKVMVGKPVIKETRLTVEYILNLLAHGATVPEILEQYQGLTPEDIQACLLFVPSLWHTAKAACGHSQMVSWRDALPSRALWR